MDVLGGAFTEQDLLSLGYSIEQTLKLRRPPFSTPGLVGGKAPAPKVVTLRPASSGAASMTLTLTYDEPRSELRYNLAVSSADAGRFVAVWIHGGTVEKPGAGRHQLFAAGRPTEAPSCCRRPIAPIWRPAASSCGFTQPPAAAAPRVCRSSSADIRRQGYCRPEKTLIKQGGDGAAVMQNIIVVRNWFGEQKRLVPTLRSSKAAPRLYRRRGRNAARERS